MHTTKAGTILPKSMDTREAQKKSNRLIHEKSPYLLQHAYNPVDWYPWGEEAFQKARSQDKPVFLSIGYSTCHWCHVMEHESFEDPEVAELMNRAFISIKVDREERPDIDNIYMTVCQMTTGAGGWPLSILLTPDKKPFFAGTYIPKNARFGRVGMMEFVPRIEEIWKQRRGEIIQSADQITAGLQQIAGSLGESADLGENALHTAFEHLYQRFDESYGGFGSAPKFPTPHQLSFLLRYWKRTGQTKALEIVEKTLAEMRAGGIYDQIGYGFHRYSTDRQWLVPHFEKMLYDQALLAIAYTETYQATRKQEFKRTAEEIFSYVLRDMTSPKGGFYSAEDADSEGVEGKFYLWTASELEEVVGPEDARFAMELFNVREGGNFVDQVTGMQAEESILHRGTSPPQAASDTPRLESIRQKLFAHRERRAHPYKDDKILTDWNGLMIAALAKAAQVFEDSSYSGAAAEAVEFIQANIRQADGSLLHRYREGQAAIPGVVDDYVFLIWGLLELYEATFDPGYLQTALALNAYLLEHFWDENSGGFFITSDNAEVLLIRSKEVYDGAVPSANSVAVLNLLRLGRLTSNPELERKAAQMMNVFSGAVIQNPAAYTQFMISLDFAIGPAFEVVIAGNPDAADTNAMLQSVRREFQPNKVILLRPADEDVPDISLVAPFTKEQKALAGKATAYVCRNYVCNKPTNDPAELASLLSTKAQRREEITKK